MQRTPSPHEQRSKSLQYQKKYQNCEWNVKFAELIVTWVTLARDVGEETQNYFTHPIFVFILMGLSRVLIPSITAGNSLYHLSPCTSDIRTQSQIPNTQKVISGLNVVSALLSFASFILALIAHFDDSDESSILSNFSNICYLLAFLCNSVSTQVRSYDNKQEKCNHINHINMMINPRNNSGDHVNGPVPHRRNRPPSQQRDTRIKLRNRNYTAIPM